MSTYDLVSTTERVLGPTLREQGFTVAGAAETQVTCADDRRAISLSYYREDLPSPWLSVAVGLRESPAENPWFVAIWRAYPEDEDLQDPAAMTFNSEPQLEDRLERIRVEWLPRYVLPLLADEAGLRSVLAEQEHELSAEHDRLVLDQHLRRAREFFDEGNYRGALDAFALHGPDTLSAADRRRCVEARRLLDDADEP